MTKMDDQLLAADLRSIFDEHSTHAAPVVDRRVGVQRRVARHKRVRALSALAVVMLAAAGAGTVTLGKQHRAPAPPSVKPTQTPGILPDYQFGGRLAATATIDLATQHSGILTFTLTSLDATIGETCAAPGSDVYFAVKINGHGLEEGGCGSTGGGGGASAPFSGKEKFWSDRGVTLGQTATITFEVGKQIGTGVHTRIVPVATTGTVSVGVYEPVPFDKYPLPPKPANWDPKADHMGMSEPEGTHKIVSIGSPPTANGASGATITLGKQLEFNVFIAAPGIVRIYIGGAEVFECSSYGWGQACGSSDGVVGKNELAGLKKGQSVWISVQLSNFSETGAVGVDVYGK